MVETIGSNAFLVCATLETVSFPAAITIGMQAFSSCPNLRSVSLPKATTIGKWAFTFNPKLHEVNLSAAETIADGIFAAAGTEDLTITLGASPPTLETGIFAQITSTKNVTVMVPSGATAGYSDPWKTGFKGGGWDGNSGLGGTVNDNVKLTLTTL
jgi:hypothetical protein